MGLSQFVFAVASFISVSGIASAQGLHVVGPLPGYACMMLNLTEQQYMDGSVRVPVRAAPAPTAQDIGFAATTVAVRAPENIVNGFAEALFPTGQTVWIAANMLRPYHNLSDPTMKCAPAKLSNGRPGFSYTH